MPILIPRTHIVLLGGASFRGAYDAFSNSIVHVYEPARRVFTSYTGNLLRLRRASDNAESDFRYVANGDLNVVAIAAWAGGASYIVTIYDQTVNADPVTQAVAASQPLFVAAAQNGHAGGTFDGTNDYLQGAYTNGGALSQPFSLYVVAQLDATAIDTGARPVTDGDDGVLRLMLRQAGAGGVDPWALYAGTALSSATATDANWHLFSALFNGVASELWLDSGSIARGDAGPDNADGLTVGGRWDGGETWKGPIVSVIICDPAHSDAQRIAMQTAMNAYWAVY